MKADGRPTARFHKHSLILNPASSVTKAAEVTVMLNIAEKKMDEEAHLIKMSGPHTEEVERFPLLNSISHEMKLHKLIQKLESESAHAVNIWLSAKLIGGKPVTYEYSVTAGKGATDVEHKWNIHMESVTGPTPMVETENGATPVKMMCVDGGMTYPIVPSTGINWKYFNHIGFGEICEEFVIRVDGTAAVSDKQKQYSKTSLEAKLCSKLTMEAQKIRKEMKYLIEVTTSETLPTFVYSFGKIVDSGLKAMLLPYIAALPGWPVVPANKVVLKLNFNQKL